MSVTKPRVRLRIFATHPVQYHVPLWRRLSEHPALDVKVFYFNDQSVRGDIDAGFGIPVAWDVDLLNGYECEFLSRRMPLDQPRAMRISDVHSLLRAERPDWVMFSGYTHGFEQQLLRAARQHGSKILMRGEFCDLSFGARSLPKRMLRDAYLRLFYRHVDRFCVIGQLARAHLLRLGVPAAAMFFSPYSVDSELLLRQSQAISRESARGALGIPPERFVFIISGKLIPRKNALECIEAIEQLRGRDAVGLIILGDGVQRDEVETRARRLLGDRCISPGFVNQTKLGTYFHAADALVMPSLHETWGLVVNEAMHYGLPCIVSSQVGCAPDLVEDRRTGYVYPVGDHVQLAARMQTMIDDREHACLMGNAALRRIEAYTISRSAQGVFRALELPDLPTPSLCQEVDATR
jgi:glycosyltransferase involved in cell wall biosynthesis